MSSEDDDAHTYRRGLTEVLQKPVSGVHSALPSTRGPKWRGEERTSIMAGTGYGCGHDCGGRDRQGVLRSEEVRLRLPRIGTSPHVDTSSASSEAAGCLYGDARL